MTVEEQKAIARMEKQSLIQKILICQRESYFVPEFLEKRTLKELRAIYAQVRKAGGEK